MQSPRWHTLAVTIAALVAVMTLPRDALSQQGRPDPKPNILFIILDDVGIDQFEIFNPHPNAIRAPVIEAIAEAGVKFTNFHTMPECSPSRVAFFTGRYPLRTGWTQPFSKRTSRGRRSLPMKRRLPRSWTRRAIEA